MPSSNSRRRARSISRSLVRHGRDGCAAKVENLLASFADAESFMEQPAAKEVASLIIEPTEELERADVSDITKLLSNWRGRGGRSLSRTG